jgi:hypothetical protein
MSGFTDAFYKESKARFDAQGHLPQKPSYYNTGVCPAAWQSCTLCMDLVT